nr:hypothetical protein [Tanacetum cinerariifolium]
MPSPPLLVLSPPLPLPSPPTHVRPTYANALLGYRAAMIQSRAISPPPIPSQPLSLPSTNYRSDIPEVDMLSRKRLCLTAPTSRVMTVIEEVNERVTDLTTTQRQDSHELQAWSRLEATSMALDASIRILEAQVRTLQTQHDRMEWQRQQAGDMVTSAFGRIHALEARYRACLDELEDTDSKHEANRNIRNGDDSHNSRSGGRRQGKSKGCHLLWCGVQGHQKRDCLELKNNNQGNQARNGNAQVRAYDVGTAGTNLNFIVITSTFLLNNRYALILFDTGADRSFMSIAFSSLIDIIPTTLDHGHDVELDNGKLLE